MRHFNYLHEYPFPISNYLKSVKGELISLFENKDLNRNSHDISLENTPLNFYLENKISKIIHDNFYLEPTKDKIIINCYIQTNSPSPTYFHSHINSPMAICGVTYIDIPKEGGEFEILHYPRFTEEKPYRIKPEEDKIYLFPNWAYHRPLPQKDPTPRLCLNIGYISNSRPISKCWGEKW